MATTTNDTSFSQPLFYAGVSIAAVLLAAILDACSAPSAEELAAAKEEPTSVEDNIKPIGTVASADKASITVAAADAASAEPRSGEDVYKAACLACHAAGVSGAPKLEAGAWDDRIAKGLEALVTSAINGIGVMPARGGNAALSDEEVRDAVIYMTEQSGYELDGAAADSKTEGATEQEKAPAGDVEPAAAEEKAAESPAQDAQAVTAGIDGEKVYKGICFTCHDSGVANAPKLGDKAAWEPRIAAGKLYENSINGVGAMPAKGGNPALSDEEIKAAVDWMLSQSQ